MIRWISLLLLSSLAAQPQNLDATQREAIARKIHALVQQYFAHWEGAPRPAVETAFKTYLDNAMRAGTRQDFDLATLRFVATLRNGHTQFSDNQADGRPPKFRLVQAEGQWAVGFSQDKNLPQGSVVRTINGRPVDDFIRDSALYVAASNERLARTHVFSYPMLFPEQITLGLQSGAIVVVDRTTPPDAPPAAGAPRGVEGRWLREGEIAYVRIPSFGDPNNESKASDLVRQFASSPNLIVDVRLNGGGTTPRQLIASLMNRQWRTWHQVAPPRSSQPQPPGRDAYSGRLFVLVDRFCGSACEDFVMPFKDTGRATIIGETTQGSSGNPYRTDLGYGMNISIGAVRYRFPNGSEFEGVGIAPDVAVERRISDLVAGRDAILEKAQELATARRTEK